MYMEYIYVPVIDAMHAAMQLQHNWTLGQVDHIQHCYNTSAHGSSSATVQLQ